MSRARHTVLNAIASLIAFIAVAACTPLKPIPPSDDLPRLSELQQRDSKPQSEFDATHSPAVPLRRTENNLLVRPLINGKDLGWFILDTGASGMTITSRAAKRAGLNAIASTAIQGQLPTTVFQGRSLNLGQLTLLNPQFAGLDMPWAKLYFGERIAGICGWDVFAHSIVEIDMQRQVVSVHDPAGYNASSAQWQPFELVNGRPHVHAQFQTQSGKTGDGHFLLDTGYSERVWLFPTAVEQFDLFDDARGREKKMIMVDASADVRNLRLDWFEFADRRQHNVEAVMSVGSATTRQERIPIAGMIGLGLLGDGRVVIDYQNSRLAIFSDK